MTGVTSAFRRWHLSAATAPPCFPGGWDPKGRTCFPDGIGNKERKLSGSFLSIIHTESDQPASPVISKESIPPLSCLTDPKEQTEPCLNPPFHSLAGLLSPTCRLWLDLHKTIIAVKAQAALVKFSSYIYVFMIFLFLSQILPDVVHLNIRKPKQNLLVFSFDYETLLFGRSFYVCLLFLEV